MQSSNTLSNDEVSLKELLLTLREWSSYLIKKWKIILLCVLIGAGSIITYALVKKPQYVAELTFVLEEGKSSQLGMYAGLASQFGIDLGASSGNGAFSGDNLLEFLTSRLMIEKSLLAPLENRNKENLANIYTRLYDPAEIKKGEHPVVFPVVARGEVYKLSRFQDSVMNVIHRDILKHNLSVSRPDKKLSFILVRCSSVSDAFSQAFTEQLVKEATDFYVTTKTKRSKLSVDKLQAKADSIALLLNRKTISAAQAHDLNLNPAKQITTVGNELLSRDIMVLYTVYGEVVKNLEISRMAMAQETPIIQVIDAPRLPLKKERISLIKGGILGAFAGGFLSICGLLILGIYKKTMLEN